MYPLPPKIMMAEISSSMEIGVASDHSPNSLTSMRSIRIYSNEPQLQKMWLDVLCIPRGSSHKVYRNERRRAIEKIDWTFARARRVLVRDKLLNNLRTETMSTMEVAAYLCCAKWLRRCWTLAEGALAWDFSIQFADRTLNFLDILKMAEAPFEPDLVVHGHFRADNREEFDIVLQRRLQTGLLAAFQRIPYSKENNTWENRSLTKSWNTLSARSTSMPTDTPLILGLLMKVSIKDLTNLDHSLRMKAILKTLAKIPAALLFNKNPKVECKPRNRWVPLNQASADQLEPGPLMGLFNEGRMSESRDAGPSRKFSVNLRGNLEQLREQEWFLVLPYSYNNNNSDWSATIYCIGFCATVRQRRNMYCSSGKVSLMSLARAISVGMPLFRWKEFQYHLILKSLSNQTCRTGQTSPP
ncbi:hypothetical protein J3E71DRAFT_212252 [Bipolaris maydis]|nr:hypothetical protein J3E73DRAFT_435234 [Bipolaris maydis]KAJ6284964.1 hypothetical protein J3E71DRAFT_212252 [Bipolaris maydis]